MRSCLAVAMASIVPLALVLGACGTITPRIAAGRSLVGAEGAFDGAIVAAAMAINTGSLPPATVKALHADADAGKAMKDAANATYAAGGTPDTAAQTQALTSLAVQITNLLPKAKP